MLLLAELIRGGAQLRPVSHPGDAAPPEASYRPSAALDRFIRAGDLTCRFPHCDRPAEVCDIDHTVAYPLGPTHPSKLRCYCCTYHLVKTFWGWQEKQLPDAALILTSPAGQTYVTTHGSALLFPQLCAPTAEALRYAAEAVRERELPLRPGA